MGRGGAARWACCLALLRPGSEADLGAAPAPPATVWDFVVVGAGTGGALCAARLAAAGAEVVLLEAGDWDGDWLYDVDRSRQRSRWPHIWGYPMRLPQRLSVQNDKDLRLRVAAGKLMGGSSSVHGDVYDRPPVREFEYGGLRRWDGAAVEAAFARIEADLSLSWEGVDNQDEMPDALYYVVSSLLDKMPLEHHPRGNRDGRKGGLTAGWTMYRTCPNRTAEHDRCRRTRRSTSYSDLVPPQNGTRGEEPPRLTVLAHAPVSRVLVEAGEAVGVELSHHGRVHEAFARRAVLLAAGAIGTPKVLTLSGIGDPFELQRLAVPEQVPNREVGANLADHLAHFAWFMVKGDQMLDEETCRDTEKFNVFFNLTAPRTGGDGPVDAEVRFYSGCNYTRKTVDFGVEGVLLHPESRGRVVVNSADAGVLPTVEFPILREGDYDRLELIYERVAEGLGLPANSFDDGRRTLAQALRSEAYLYQHFCCTARAAPPGEPGVCDEDLRVRGVRGLYVADASALPAPPSSHTSAPAMLVAELAAAAALADEGQRRLPSRALAADGAARAALLAAAPAPREAAPAVPRLPLRGQPPDGSAEAAPGLPAIGLGTGTLAAQRVTESVASFLRLGGRHLDTAVMYDNYADVRAGIEASGVGAGGSGAALFVTWKVMPLGSEYVRAEVRRALDALGVAVLDAALLHWPGDISAGKLMHGKPPPPCVEDAGEAPGVGTPLRSWKRCRQESYAALEAERAAGRVRAVGVSNFAARHLDDLAAQGLEPPAVSQLEMHPLWHEEELLERHAREGTRVQAYGCLGGAVSGAPLLTWEGFKKIAANRNFTPAQVLLRWAAQRGAAVITGGSSPEHLRENLQIFSFELTETEMDFMSSISPEAMRKTYGPLPEEIL